MGRSRVPPKPVPPLTLVVGDEDLLVARAVSRVVRAARAAEPDIEVRDLDAPSLAPGDLAELLSPSLFGDRKVVVVRAAHELGKDVAAELTDVATQALDDVVLVVHHAGAAKGKALLTALAATGAPRVDAPKVTKPAERREFVRAELRADGRVVEEDAVSALLEAVGTDLRELASASSQLLSDTEGTITVEAVARYHRGKAEASGFAIADRAVDGDLAGALELARWGQATGLAHVLVTSSLASTLRAMAQVAGAGRNSNSYQLASQLGMPAWKVEKTQRQARGWRPEGLSAAMQAVATADGDVKGGAADQDYAVERALLAVVQARGGGR